MRHIEERWAYYLAFGTFSHLSSYYPLKLSFVGMPAAFLCNWGNSLTNAAIFALIYPYVSTFAFVEL